MTQPIGVMDSGIGGLSVLREIHHLLPFEDLLYVADQHHLPYGTRSLDEVRLFTEGITRFLLEQHARLIVIACNTASAAALHDVRETFPDMRFVGLEPAVRPAARDTQSGTIGVIATKATFQGRLYESLIDRFANGLNVITRACPELVTLAERGAPYNDADYALVRDILADIHAAGADQLVLGCTHFAFLKPLLQAAMGSDTAIVDPAPAVARQVRRVLYGESPEQAHFSNKPGRITLLTTGTLEPFASQIRGLLNIKPDEIGKLTWRDGTLYAEKADKGL